MGVVKKQILTSGFRALRSHKPRSINTPRRMAEWYLSMASPYGDCLIPHRKPNSHGYVYVHLPWGGYQTLHRFIYHYIMENVPEDKQILHSCDIRSCINPNHLRIGDAGENTQDMLRNKRGKNQYGSY